jgi:hypothetical protein
MQHASLPENVRRQSQVAMGAASQIQWNVMQSRLSPHHQKPGTIEPTNQMRQVVNSWYVLKLSHEAGRGVIRYDPCTSIYTKS